MTAVPQPSGEVTLVFSDIEGSTRLLEELGTDAYREALSEHRRIVREAYARYRGYEVDYEGDAFFYAFPSAPDAVAAVSEAMAGLEAGPIAIRVGIHTGAPGLDPPKYVGMDVHFAARVMSSAHGGQVICSPATAALVDASFTDLGEHRLKDIEQAVPLYQLGEGSFPPLKTISNTNLPRPASSFLGREAELQDVISRIEQGTRLLTLTGPGGTGKTRLALEAASMLVPEYKAGVFWVGLASLREPALVTATIAQTLGAKDGLAEYIQERELLLLLDNLEQVIETAPELSSLLSACPNLTLVVTSRELLRVQGEVEYLVPPLVQPEAISLFCERSGLESSDEIAELCARLDNLPLAIELAAARTKVFSVSQIRERLSGRLDLLKGGRDADPRQQTIRATIEWSYDLLSPEEQQLFARLSVFAGGCTLEDAEVVLDVEFEAIASLVDKSLLRAERGRVAMLETIGEFARERLEETDEATVLRERHARHYLEVVREADEQLTGPQQADWFMRLAHEQDNIRAALTWAAESQDHELAIALVAAAGWFWFMRGEFEEGSHWIDAALATGAGSPSIRATVLMRSGAIADGRGDYEKAEKQYRQAFELRRRDGDAAGSVGALNNLGALAYSQADYEIANAWYEQGLAMARKSDDELGIATALGNMGIVAISSGEPTRAVSLLEESIGVLDRLGHRYALAVSRQALGSALLDLDNLDLAAEQLSEALELHWELDEPLGVAATLEELAALAAVSGHGKRAARQLGAASAIRTGMGAAIHATDEPRRTRAASMAVASIGKDTFDAAYSEGLATDLDAAVESALAPID